MTTPTVIFLNNHNDPATFQFLASFSRYIKRKGFSSFMDEEDSGHPVEAKINSYSILSTLGPRIKAGGQIARLLEQATPCVFQRATAQERVFPYAIRFYQNLIKDNIRYEACEYLNQMEDLTLTKRDNLYAALYLREAGIAALGLAHWPSLPQAILRLGQEKFNLTQTELAQLFVFVYLHSDAPMPDENQLESRLRNNEVAAPFELHTFDLNQPDAQTAINTQTAIYQLIDAKIAQLNASPLKNFRKQRQPELAALVTQIKASGGIVPVQEAKPRTTPLSLMLFDINHSRNRPILKNVGVNVEVDEDRPIQRTSLLVKTPRKP